MYRSQSRVGSLMTTDEQHKDKQEAQQRLEHLEELLGSTRSIHRMTSKLQKEEAYRKLWRIEREARLMRRDEE